MTASSTKPPMRPQSIHQTPRETSERQALPTRLVGENEVAMNLRQIRFQINDCLR